MQSCESAPGLDLSDPIDSLRYELDAEEARPYTPEQEVTAFTVLAEQRRRYFKTLLQTPVALSHFVPHVAAVAEGNTLPECYFTGLNRRDPQKKAERVRRVRATVDALYGLIPQLQAGVPSAGAAPRCLEQAAALLTDLKLKPAPVQAVHQAITPELAPEERSAMHDLRSAYLGTRGDIMQHNIRHAFSLARKYTQKRGEDNETLIDLYTENKIVLFRAVDGFEVNQGNKFSTYSWYAMANKMENFLKRKKRERREHQTFRQKQIEDGNYEYRDAGREPRDALPMPLQIWTEAAKLDDREKLIIDQRFGFHGEAMTQKEVGARLGRTKARIQQIEKAALQKMRLALSA